MKMHVKLLLCLVAGIFLLLPFAVNAQIAIDLSMNRPNYIQFEKVFAKVVLRNDSGHAIAAARQSRRRGHEFATLQYVETVLSYRRMIAKIRREYAR